MADSTIKIGADGLVSDLTDLIVGFQGSKSIYKAWANINGETALVYFNPQTVPTYGSYLNAGDTLVDLNSTYLGEPIRWKVAGKSLSGMPVNSLTLVSEFILDFLPFDAKEPTNPNTVRRDNGNPLFKFSNIKGWLNSETSNWYIPLHSYDAPPTAANVTGNPYDTQPGFQMMFSKEMKNHLLTTAYVSARPQVDGGGQETSQASVLLPSKTELGLGVENSISEGSILPIFSVANATRLAYPTALAAERGQISTGTSSPVPYATRTSEYQNGGIRTVLETGSGTTVLNVSANVGIRPMINIKDTVVIYGPIEGIYYISSEEIDDFIQLLDKDGNRLLDKDGVPLIVRG